MLELIPENLETVQFQIGYTFQPSSQAITEVPDLSVRAQLERVYCETPAGRTEQNLRTSGYHLPELDEAARLGR